MTLSPVVTGDHEKWIIYNDFMPEANETIESGHYVSMESFIIVTNSFETSERTLYDLR